MKQRLSILAITGSLVLAACSQGPAPTPQNAELTIDLVGLPANATAPITIRNSANQVVTGYDNRQVTDNFKATLPRGAYTVTAGSVTGFNTPVVSGSADLTNGNATTVVTYTPVEEPPPASGPIAKIDLVRTANGSQINALIDERGQFFPGRQEVNQNKTAYLFAAQTEETVCVPVRVVDAQNRPVPNASVKIQLTGPEAENIAVTPGCVPGSQGGATPLRAQNVEEVVTDSNGIARFTLYSTYESGLSGEPVKVVATASQNGTTVTPVEFKMFFLNMSHLYRSFEGGAAVNTNQRVGRNFGTETNIFNSRTDRAIDANDTFFNTLAFEKQPQRDAAQPQELFPGFVRYTITGPGAQYVQFVNADAPDSISADGLTFTDRRGGTTAGARIRPRANLTRQVLTQGPVEFQVRAEYVFETTYGNTTYQFPLKDYTFTKRYTSGFLTITKSINNRVLTWAGPNVLLTASTTTSSVFAQEPFVATATITVRNTSTQPVFNANVRDALPAELGVVTDTISNGGTYDAVLHAVTWNNTTTPGLGAIQPGETRTFTFQVYARQKPGYQYNNGARPATETNFFRAPINAPGTPYNDPYVVTNGSVDRDVTVGYFQSADNFGGQLVEDYTPTNDESDINVVRPLFRISKTLAAGQQNPVPLGGAAVFNINVSQIDRVANETAYRDLFNRYPGEFNNTTATPGLDTPRANPYGRNVIVRDVFENQLDFTNATPLFNNAGLTGTQLAQPSTSGANQAGKSIVYSAVPLLQRGDSLFGRVFLNTNAVGTFYNCAYVDASNLNQPRPTTTSGAVPLASVNPVLPWAYQAPYIPGFIPWTQYENDRIENTTLPTARPASPTFNTTALDAQQRIGIESCAPITVVQGPQVARLTFTNRGEYTDFGPTLIDANKQDGFSAAGFTGFFSYKFDSQNTGGGAANGVVFSFTRDNDNVIFPANPSGTPAADYYIYIFNSPSDVVPAQTIRPAVTFSGRTITFPPVNIPAGGVARVVFPGDPNRPGVTTVDGVLTATTLTGETVTLNTQEVTTVNP